MHARRLLRDAAPRRHGSRWLLLGLLLALGFSDAAAQRPFRISDPFYRNETARRDFFDRYALTGEVSYRSSGALQDEGLASSADLAFRFRFDYELAPRLDLGAVFEVVGGNGGRKLGLSWLVLKYYRYLEEADYAFRLAVDPSSDGRAGFPQVDLAFLYTSLLSPVLSSDFALGVRRVNIGYAQFIPPAPLPREGPFVVRPRPTLLATRALGTELHLMINYNFHFDPAGSNFFVGLLGEGGRYDLVQSSLSQTGTGARAANDVGAFQAEQPALEQKTAYRGGALWARGGVEFKRPSYQFSPFLSLPLQQWNPEGDWPEARLQAGVMLMLR